jgi:hypothetical protein
LFTGRNDPDDLDIGIVLPDFEDDWLRSLPGTVLVYSNQKHLENDMVIVLHVRRSVDQGPGIVSMWVAGGPLLGYRTHEFGPDDPVSVAVASRCAHTTVRRDIQSGSLSDFFSPITL